MRIHRFISDRLFSRIDIRLVGPVRDRTAALGDETAALREEIAVLRADLEAAERRLSDLTVLLLDANELARARARRETGQAAVFPPPVGANGEHGRS